MLAKEIFRQELTEIYAEQTLRRNQLTVGTEERLKELIGQMQTGEMESSRIEQLMEELSQSLKGLSGKKQYGYLKAPLKSLADEIVDELAKDERVKAAYDLWYEMREEVLHTYSDKLPERLPLSQQPELKRIKNMVIEEAVQLGERKPEFMPENVRPDEEQPGPDRPQTSTESEKQTENRTPEGQNTATAHDHRSDPWVPRPVQCVTKLLRHMGRVFEENPPPRMQTHQFTDRKLLQQIQEKKIAHGHKADDHEDPKMTMQ